LVPFWARSVGLLPVRTPQKPRGSSGCPRSSAPHRCLPRARPAAGGRATASSRRPGAASPAAGASRSCPSRSPSPAAASPRDAALPDEDDAGQAGAVIDRRSAASARPGPVARKQGLDDLPQLIRPKRPSHGAPPVSDDYYRFAYGAPFLLEFLTPCSPPRSASMPRGCSRATYTWPTTAAKAPPAPWGPS